MSRVLPETSLTLKSLQKFDSCMLKNIFTIKKYVVFKLRNFFFFFFVLNACFTSDNQTFCSLFMVRHVMGVLIITCIEYAVKSL